MEDMEAMAAPASGLLTRKIEQDVKKGLQSLFLLLTIFLKPTITQESRDEVKVK